MANKVVSRAANSLDDKTAKESFSLSLLAAGRKLGTVETYEKALFRLNAVSRERNMPGALYMSTEHLREYFADLYQQGWQSSTISIHYRALQQFYKWAVIEGERPDNPLERIPSPKLEEKIQPHYSPADVQVPLNETTTIEISNEGSAIHTFRIAGADGEWNTDDDVVTADFITDGDSASVEFTPTLAGTYTFRCDVHWDVQGGVIVAG